MKINQRWPKKPKSLSEKGYRKYMAKTKKVTINEREYTLQSVSPTFYMDSADANGMSGGNIKRNTSGYMDALFKNCVISPPEVKAEGIAYFDKDDDIKGARDLMSAIEAFLVS